VADLVTQMAEQRAVGLAQSLSPALPLGIISLG
jgi:hypothetical protein